MAGPAAGLLPDHHPTGDFFLCDIFEAPPKDELGSNKGRVVVELSGQKVLVQDFMGDIFAVSNKCPHLGLSMQVTVRTRFVPSFPSPYASPCIHFSRRQCEQDLQIIYAFLETSPYSEGVH